MSSLAIRHHLKHQGWEDGEGGHHDGPEETVRRVVRLGISHDLDPTDNGGTEHRHCEDQGGVQERVGRFPKPADELLGPWGFWSQVLG